MVGGASAPHTAHTCFNYNILSKEVLKMMNSPYQIERNELIKRCNLLYPYGIKWFQEKPNHVLIALIKKKREKKNEKKRS